MNNTEINTLLGNKVDPQTIIIAMAAGKIQGAVSAARRAIDMAEQDKVDVNWQELFRYMELIDSKASPREGYKGRGDRPDRKRH